jgi:hypothetical protein
MPIPPVDASILSAPAQRILQAPEKMREMAARGIAPGVRPDELVLILVVLTSQGGALATIASQTLQNLPPPVLQGALGTDLHPAAIDALAVHNLGRLDVLERVVRMPRLDPDTVERMAQYGGELATELIATNEERLLANPRIIEKLYMNKATRMSTADRLVELAVRNGVELNGIGAWREVAAAIQDELILEASSEPTPDDILFRETQALAEQLQSEADEDTHEEDDEGREQLKLKFMPLYQRIANMTPSQKIRSAMLGTKEERMLLVRDTNRMVAVAAIRSPQTNENEAILISRNKSISDEVLRVIGSTPEFTKSYQVKKNLSENPRTPVMIAIRLVTHLREHDLRAIAKSKNVTGPVQDAARRHLERRRT